MTTITFVEPDGTQHRVKARNGRSLMQTALDHGVPRVEGQCGGALACATCQVSIGTEWIAVTGTASFLEEALLDLTGKHAPNARLSCQIKVSEALDGLVVLLPESQL